MYGGKVASMVIASAERAESMCRTRRKSEYGEHTCESSRASDACAVVSALLERREAVPVNSKNCTSKMYLYLSPVVV